MFSTTLVVFTALTTSSAWAQPSTTTHAPTPVAASPTPSTEAEYLVPPQGGAFEVPIHAGAVVILSFPEKMAKLGLTSSTEYEIKSWGDDGVAVRAVAKTARAATLALATASGAVKVNVTLRVVPNAAQALTLVRFKSATAAEAFRTAVDTEVGRRTQGLEAELADARKTLDRRVRDRADGMVARRILQRLETQPLTALDRNGDNVIVRVQRAVFLGEDAYLIFQIQNRSSGAYRLATVTVSGPDGTQHAGPASLATTAIDDDEGVIGVVPAGGRGQGVVTLRQVDSVLGKPLTLTLGQPGGRGRISVARGIVLR